MQVSKELKELFPNIEKHVEAQMNGVVYIEPQKEEQMHPLLVGVIIFGFGFFLTAMLVVNAISLTPELICK